MAVSISNSKLKSHYSCVSQNSQFKEQSENQNTGDSPDKILRHSNEIKKCQ